MKHNLKITFILLGMFIITQLIGLLVINFYTTHELPYGMQPPTGITPATGLSSFIISFVIAIALILLLMKFRFKIILKLWFFLVVILSLGLTLSAIFINFNIIYAAYIALALAIPLAIFKVFRQNMLVHNLTELFIYPGIAAVFVSLLSGWGALSIFAVVFLLVLISAYDIYAVWHAGFMQKMAKFQINELKFFAGFFIPYADKKTKEKIKLLKSKYKEKRIPNSIVKKQKIKISLAILGGGDVVFPIIAAGVLLRLYGIIPALFVTLFASLALLLLFILARKGKFYPAMPFISAGIFVGMIIGLLMPL